MSLEQHIYTSHSFALTGTEATLVARGVQSALIVFCRRAQVFDTLETLVSPLNIRSVGSFNEAAFLQFGPGEGKPRNKMGKLEKEEVRSTR